MARIERKSTLRITAIGVALALAAGSAVADRPSWAGGGKHKEGREHHEEREHGVRGGDGERRNAAVAFSFGSDDDRIVRDYYGSQVRKGHCPPGLAKKNNGCLPPGQTRKWQRGRPLAKDIRYYELPRDLLIRLPAPPPNYRYVRIAGDILMIAAGTGMVVDAIEDILR